MDSRRRWGLPAGGLLGAVILGLGLFVADGPDSSPPANLISGPYARLIAESVDLGPARSDRVQLTAALNRPARPVELTDWARDHGLSVRWRDGEPWAIVEGAPDAVADAFGVAIHNYRARRGDTFYASPQQPVVPPATRGEVAGVGRILSYTPFREGLPPTPPRDVPARPACRPRPVEPPGMTRFARTPVRRTAILAVGAVLALNASAFADLLATPKAVTLDGAEATQQLLVAAEANLHLEARLLRCGGGALHHGVDRRDTDREVRVPDGLWRAKEAAQRGVR